MLFFYILIVSLSYFLSKYFIQNPWIIFISLVTLESIIFYIVFLNLHYKQKLEQLNIKLVEKDKDIEKLHKDFQIKLIQKAEQTIFKYEELKLLSLKDMIKNISHQWRQPLSSISLIATTMEYEKNNQNFQIEEVLESFSIINENAQYLSHILDLFDTSLCIKKEKSIFRLESLIIALSHLKTTKIKIVANIKENISIYSYKKDLLQVLINIANNSKEIFEKREIKEKYLFIDIFSKDNYFIIDIKDNGGGIDEKIIHRVFEPYFTTKHQSQGTGLELYSAYLTVSKKLGGTITVQNSEYMYNGEEYVGARFRIKAPIK